MIDYALNKMDEDMDIKNLMDLYREFDRLKKVLFEKDQILLLDFVPKPKIYPSNLQDPKQIFAKKTTNEDKFDMFLNVV